MNSIGIFAAPGKARARGLVLQLIALCEAAGVQVCLPHSWAHDVERPELGAPDNEVAAQDALVVFSGDGGILAAARATAPFGTPILGVDLGRLGFLSSVRPDELENAFRMLRDGAFEIEERMMLDARVLRRREHFSEENTALQSGTALYFRRELLRSWRQFGFERCGCCQKRACPHFALEYLCRRRISRRRARRRFGAFHADWFHSLRAVGRRPDCASRRATFIDVPDLRAHIDAAPFSGRPR